MSEDEIDGKKKRLMNLKPWRKGQSGNPTGRPKITSYKDLFYKWMTLPLCDKLTNGLAKTFDLDDKDVQKLNLQEFFFLSFLKAGLVECQKEHPSYFKVKDLNQTLMLFCEKNGISEKETNRIQELFDFEEEDMNALKSIFRKKFSDESSEEHKITEEENEQEENQ